MKKGFLCMTIIFTVITIIGIISYFGGVHHVNAGIFVFPFILAVVFFYLSKKKSN